MVQDLQLAIAPRFYDVINLDDKNSTSVVVWDRLFNGPSPVNMGGSIILHNAAWRWNQGYALFRLLQQILQLMLLVDLSLLRQILPSQLTRT